MDTGYFMLATGHWKVEMGYGILDMGYVILDIRLLDIQPQCELDMRSTILGHIVVGNLSKLLETCGGNVEAQMASYA